MKSSPTGKKRVRLTTAADEHESFVNNIPELPTTKSSSPSASLSPLNASVSSFRNVSACNRCRQRKNRCDQNLPACSSCEKAGVKCVGFDPITKREIPRAYVYYLESRVTYLESLLSENDIKYAPSQEFDLGAKPALEHANGSGEGAEKYLASSNVGTNRAEASRGQGSARSREDWEQKQEEADKLNKLVSNIGMVSVKGASDPRYLGSTSGISFARVVFAAVKSCVSSTSSENGGSRKPGNAGPDVVNGTSMRDSFFGLHTRPTIKQALFPDKSLGLSLVELYFEHANPQIPILHRGEFMTLFERAYALKDRHRSSRELYMLNIVFAIGAGIILDNSRTGQSPESTASVKTFKHGPASHDSQTEKFSQQSQPEEYHASAMMLLESCLVAWPSSERPE